MAKAKALKSKPADTVSQDVSGSTATDNERVVIGDNSGLSAEDLAEVFADGASVDGEALKELPKHVDRYVELEGEIEALAETMQQRATELRELRTVTLPDLMKRARITLQDMESGHRITLGTSFQGGFPEDPDKRKKAFRALKKLDATDILKHMIVTEFTPEQHDEARKVLQYLQRKKLPVTDDMKVHAATYKKWAREMVEDEKVAPFFLGLIGDLGLHMIEQATVKLLKPKKRKTDGKSEETAGNEAGAVKGAGKGRGQGSARAGGARR